MTSSNSHLVYSYEVSDRSVLHINSQITTILMPPFSRMIIIAIVSLLSGVQSYVVTADKEALDKIYEATVGSSWKSSVEGCAGSTCTTDETTAGNATKICYAPLLGMDCCLPPCPSAVIPILAWRHELTP